MRATLFLPALLLLLFGFSPAATAQDALEAGEGGVGPLLGEVDLGEGEDLSLIHI